MIADQWCETSWRAKPGSFVSLMTLYESNFVRLGWLVSDLRSIDVALGFDGRRRIVISISRRWSSRRYTSVFRLTYEFDSTASAIRDPDLEVCVYHDARLAEVRSFRGFQRHPAARQAALRTQA